MKKKLLALELLSLSAITLCSCHHVMSHEKFIVPTTFDENKQYEFIAECEEYQGWK